MVFSWAYITNFDTDKNSATGFQIWGIGADFILEENEFKIYAGTGAEDWQWATTGVASLGVSGCTVELSMPMRFLKGASQIRMHFVGDNQAYEPNGTGEDAVPDPNPDDRWIDYDLALNQGSVGDLPQ